MRPPDPLRIAVFTYGVQPRGGVVHALSLTEALCRRGHDAELFALDDTGRGLFRAPECRVTYVPVEPSVSLAAGEKEIPLAFVQRRIEAFVDAFGPAMNGFDIYHAHDGIGGNALATLAASSAIGGYVRTVHHIDDFPDPTLATLQDLAILRADRCYTVSALWQRELAERYDLESDVVPNGVDVARFSPVAPERRAALRARLGIAGEPFFVSIGGVEARKNTLGLLEGFARVLVARPDARLTIAGGSSVFDHGTYRRAFDERLAELGDAVRDAITIAGPLPDDEIVALLRAADALVFPSLVEGFGLVLLEALACGTPAVTSQRAPFTEFLSEEDAVFVDPLAGASIAEGMLRALDPAVATPLRAHGPSFAARHTWDASAIVHEARYRESIARRETANA
jgi:glycosyltransferase-like protein